MSTAFSLVLAGYCTYLICLAVDVGLNILFKRQWYAFKDIRDLNRR